MADDPKIVFRIEPRFAWSDRFFGVLPRNRSLTVIPSHKIPTPPTRVKIIEKYGVVIPLEPKLERKRRRESRHPREICEQDAHIIRTMLRTWTAGRRAREQRRARAATLLEGRHRRY